MSLFSMLLRPLLGYWAHRARPQMEGNLALHGLKEKATVRWDPYTVPHVVAATEHDLFMAQGYLHAQERLWQMDFTRRFHTGRLAEILGERPVPWQEITVRLKDKTTVDLDYFIRLMGIRRTACASLGLLPRGILNALEAYSDGVNRYIESHFRRLPVEFRLLRYDPDPWLPEDCLTIGKGFSLLLSTALFTRLTADAIVSRLHGEDDKIASLLPRYPEWGPAIVRCDDRGPSQDSERLLKFLNGTFYSSLWAAAGQGSNNWVLAPGRSTDGGAMLCNDPHLRMTLPSIWYLMGLEAPAGKGRRDGYTARGASIPGTPFIHLGHNRHVAWGVTAALCDDVEVYREKVHPENPDRYLVKENWESMECLEERIRIRGGREVAKTLRLTRHGPVIGDFTGMENAGEILSLRWTALDLSEDLRVVDGVNRARGWTDFLESLSHQNSPTLNYLYADREGNIGYSLAGRVPLRGGPPSLLPLPGWSGEFDWKGFLPFDELPRLYNPPEGVIATANNAMTDASYPHYLSVLFEPPYRIERIRDLLTAKERFSPEDMAAMQDDVVSLQARSIIEALRDDFEEIAGTEAPLKEALAGLMAWDGGCGAESAESALYHVFYAKLMKNLLEADLGEDLLLAFQELFNQSVAPTDQIMKDRNSPWFRKRSRLSLVRASLMEARAELESKLGDTPRRWQWGNLHTLTLDHPLGRVGILAPFFSLGPYPAPGDWATVNSGFYRHSFPYDQVVGSSLRMVLTPKSWERCRIVLPSGQSGSPVSPHYRDQLELWLSGKSIGLDHAAGETGRWPTLILSPTTARDPS